MALVHWMQLALTDGIGPILSRRIVEAAGGVEGACTATAALLKQIDGIGKARAGQFAQSLAATAGAAREEIERARAAGVTVLCPEDEPYPVLLRSIPDPPVVLYVRGNFEPRDFHAVAIVGSRKCTFYGREQSERFAALLAGAGVTVISGGARGIDSAAHRGAMAHPQGRTIAVLGTGVDTPYPPENKELFDRIAAGRGAVVSEFPLGTPPNRENFPRRNRIVSGMSRGVLVVEADEMSGALITARQACDDHGRPVFALPGRVDSPTSAGPHKLIRDGAVLVRNLEDILEGLDPLPQDAVQAGLFDYADARGDGAPDERPASPVAGPGPTSRAPGTEAGLEVAGLSERQQRVLEGIGAEPTDVDSVIARTSLPAHVVLQELTFLSLKGRIRRVDGQTYARRPT